MLNLKQLLDVVGADLEAEHRGAVRRVGPTMEERLARAFGGTTSQHHNTTRYLRWRRKLQDQLRSPGDTTARSFWADTAPSVYERQPPTPTEDADSRIARLLAFIEQLDADREFRQEEAQLAAEFFDQVARHEARHACVGLERGCRISEIFASGHGGHVSFEDQPPRDVTIAGSVWDDRGICEPSASSDREKVEKDIADEIDRRWPEATPLDRQYARADLLEGAEVMAKQILSDRHQFYVTIRDLLLERGHASESKRAWVSGEEAHAIWRDLYEREEVV